MNSWSIRQKASAQGISLHMLIHLQIAQHLMSLKLQKNKAQLLEKITLDPDGDSYTGSFSLQAYDPSGNPTVLFTGSLKAKRITINTPFSDLL